MRRRGLVVAVLCVAGILLVGRLAQPDGSELERPAPAPSALAPSAAPSNGPAPEVGASPSAQEQQARAMAVSFAAAYASAPEDGQGIEFWHQSVAGMATADLAEGLRYTEPERLPRGEVVAATVLEVEDAAVAVAVDLDTGVALLVTVEPTAAGWRVSDVRPRT